MQMYVVTSSFILIWIHPPESDFHCPTNLIRSSRNIIFREISSTALLREMFSFATSWTADLDFTSPSTTTLSAVVRERLLLAQSLLTI